MKRDLLTNIDFKTAHVFVQKLFHSSFSMVLVVELNECVFFLHRILVRREGERNMTKQKRREEGNATRMNETEVGSMEYASNKKESRRTAVTRVDTYLNLNFARSECFELIF